MKEQRTLAREKVRCSLIRLAFEMDEDFDQDLLALYHFKNLIVQS